MQIEEAIGKIFVQGEDIFWDERHTTTVIKKALHSLNKIKQVVRVELTDHAKALVYFRYTNA